jgi:hypothetical protein
MNDAVDITSQLGSLSLKGGEELTRRDFLATFHKSVPWHTSYREWIPDDHPYFQRVLDLCEKLDLKGENRWKNFSRLLLGRRGLPVLLLQNPTWSHMLPFLKMVKETETFRRLRDELWPIGLTLG